jgi:regulator of sigma E protease
MFAAIGRVSEKHYFLGTGNSLFTVQIRDVKFSVAWWFPMAINFRNFGGLPITRVQAIIDGTKQRARQTWEFGERSILRRFLVTIAPSSLLMFIGIVYSIGVIYATKESYISKDYLNSIGIYPSPLGRELGFKRGDKIIAVNGHDFESFEQIIEESGSPGAYLTVQRDNKNLDIQLKGTKQELITGEFGNFISPDVPFTVRFVHAKSPAAYKKESLMLSLSSIRQSESCGEI